MPLNLGSCCLPCARRDSLQTFYHTFLKQVRSKGFEQAYKSNLHTFAEFAESDPINLCSCIEKWLHADKSLKLLPGTAEPPTAEEQTDRVPDEPIPGVTERDGTPVKVYNNEVFSNWGGTVRNVPRYTFVPKTQVGVINIVKFAKKRGLRVRASGARHSWSNVYGSSDEVLISMMEPGAATTNSRFGFPEPNPQDTELERVQFDGEFTDGDGVEHGRVRLGAAATADHFRKWALSEQGGNWEWMIRALPILTAITTAGWTQVICHGAGITHKSVSDLVLEVVIVNYEGKLQTIKDKELLLAVSGGFGLLGVVLEQVFVLDRLKIADFFPAKVPTVLGVPPVSREDVPINDDFDVAKVTDAELTVATKEFERDCRHKFYSEWFWFPFQPEVWVNVWNTSEPTGERPIYPDAKEIRQQKLQSAVAKIFEQSLLKLLPARKQAELTGFAAMKFLPGGELIKTSVPDALHFRRGIHLLPVRDCEIEIEIPPRADGSSDFSVCQKAWWMAITAVYEELPNAPMRTTLEMRIMGGSDVTMCTQRGNDYGTCSIEVLTNSLVDDEEWAAFIEKVTEQWATLKNTVTGKPLRIRPHFAKEWPRRIRGTNIADYLKAEYRKEVPEFREQMRKAAAQGGYLLEDAFGLFGNNVILDLVQSK